MLPPPQVDPGRALRGSFCFTAMARPRPSLSSDCISGQPAQVGRMRHWRALPRRRACAHPAPWCRGPCALHQARIYTIRCAMGDGDALEVAAPDSPAEGRPGPSEHQAERHGAGDHIGVPEPTSSGWSVIDRRRRTHIAYLCAAQRGCPGRGAGMTTPGATILEAQPRP